MVAATSAGTNVTAPGQHNPLKFYGNYYGHILSDLEALHRHVGEKSGDRGLIFLAGDSSLDNKHWLFVGDKTNPGQLTNDKVTADAPPPYKEFFQPPRCVQDVAYWLTRKAASVREGKSKVGPYAAINSALEASTLADRDKHLTDHDTFVRDHIASNDILVVSVAANDIALRPTRATVSALGTVLSLPDSSIKAATASTPGIDYFVDMFNHKIASYIAKLTAKQKPKSVLVCMIYFPDETVTDSWANGALAMLGYNDRPGKLQMVIEKVYELATCKVDIPGTKVVPVPLFRALDGRVTGDYEMRVEPSVVGGSKIADLIWEVIEGQGKGSHI
ncbi:uncharacterized protein EV422DRAFT_568095 [Fimicolochytrium jonesii]|uniref:uncharacterized protein n=1 Tax=Fimicolochytrium jonesii TaxID=1396493 RepID=UPI0022FE7D4C|nr:uncharacterized protein EV422DRAFT_568095 [Fimicolochytrium jonesii]KAI8820140.1 hypothetical protein EV422DRAFT_568095 [Fimicolochytrium jonesii]